MVADRVGLYDRLPSSTYRLTFIGKDVVQVLFALDEGLKLFGIDFLVTSKANVMPLILLKDIHVQSSSMVLLVEMQTTWHLIRISQLLHEWVLKGLLLIL